MISNIPIIKCMKENNLSQGTIPGRVPEAASAVYSANLPKNPEDARVKFVFSENDMDAYGDFIPAMGKGESLTEEYVNSLLEKMNIVHGIQQESIIKAINTCNSEKKIQNNVSIASGTPVQNEVAEYMQINPILVQGQAPSSGGKVDHRSLTPYIIVKKGMALAKQKSRKPGIDGTNIHGIKIPFKVLRPQSVEGGVNTRMDGKFLLSEIDGQMIVSKNIINIHEDLNIKGPVGYKTGHITFPGDVTIEGPVSDGFKIHSGGSVTIKQTFDVTEAVTKGDLNVTGGIIGRGLALLKVGGSLKTRFIQNCKVACRKSIFVNTEIINSQIYTMDKIEMGDKGIIIGGEINAINGITAGRIGGQSTKAVKIRCGTDFSAVQERDRNSNAMRLLTAKLERIKQLLQESINDQAKKTKLEELKTRLEDEYNKALEKVNELSGRIHINENAAVEVTGEISAGTLIEICNVDLFVTEPLKKVRVTLDTVKGKLVTAPL